MNNNLSDRITSEDCAGCGKCCEVFEISYPKDDGTEKIKIIRSEMIRFQMLSEIGNRISIRESDDCDWLVFHFPCEFLTSDKRCKIHENDERPYLCKKFPYWNSTVEDCHKLRYQE